MNIQSIDRATEWASSLVMAGMGGMRLAELGEDTYRWINKIDKRVPFKFQTSPKLVRGLSSVALVSSFWYGYRAASHLYHGTSEDEVNDWLRVFGAGLSVANLGAWVLFPSLRNPFGARRALQTFRHLTFFGGVALDMGGLGYALGTGASWQEAAMQALMLLVFNTGREDRALYGQYVKKLIPSPLTGEGQGEGGKLVHLDDHRPKPPNDNDPEPQANQAALLMAAGAEDVLFPDPLRPRLHVIDGEHSTAKGLNVFASSTGDDDVASDLTSGQVRHARGLSSTGPRISRSVTPLPPLDPDWKVLDTEHFVYPLLGKALPAILAHPETVSSRTVIPQDRLQRVRQLTDWIADDVFGKWDKDCRTLNADEQTEIKQALELRLKAVARIDPRFIRFFQRLYDGDYRGDSVNASPYMIGTPLDSALTHLWGLLVCASRWGRASTMTGEDIDFFRAVPRESVRKPIIIDGKEDLYFYIMESPGFEETSGGIDRSLWYKGKYRLNEGRDFRELMDKYKGPGQYRGSILLATSGYKRTPKGYVIELAQGEPALLDVSVDVGRGGFTPLMNVLTSRFQHHTTWIARNLLTDLRQSNPTHPIYFRSPIYMGCIDYRLLSQKPPRQYLDSYRDLDHAVSQLSPVKIKKMLLAKKKELEKELAKLEAQMPFKPRDELKYFRVMELKEFLGYMSSAEKTWNKLTKIAHTLGFKLENPQSSVMALRP